MNKVFMPLANMDFATMLNEARSNTTSGEQLLNNYRRVLLTNESTCGLVNRFVKEAQQYRYDNGVNQVLEDVCEVIDKNKISWQLATACESVNNNTSSFNYLNRNAARQVEDLLEGKNEEDVVKYIKAGALKNIMFCESFRNIVKSVYENKQVIITDNYTAVRPVSYVEENEENVYFEVCGHIYKVNEGNINEASVKEVSNDFIECSKVLEGNGKFEDEVLTIKINPSVEYVIKEEEGCKTCTRRVKKKDEVKEQTFDNAESLREHNRLVVSSIIPNKQREMDYMLEQVAKCYEHFDNFALLDNTQIISTDNDKFLVIESGTNAFAMSLGSNHTNAWKVNTSIVEALNFVKSKTHVDVKKDYITNIEESFEKRSEEEQLQIQESIENDAIEARKRKIEQLTEQYKNEPEKLAVLAKVAEQLNSL